MEPKFQSSFIPKGPIATASPISTPQSKPKTALFGFLGMLLFVISLILAVGAFAYDRYLLSSIGTMGENLASARASLQPDTIKELVNADKRIIATRGLLSRHTALTPFFDFLETATLKSVRFTEFSFDRTDKGIEVILKGQARGYSDIALQSDAFNKSKIFTNPVFSDLELDPKGNVTFSFHAFLDPAAVTYKRRIDGMPIGSTQPANNAIPLQASTTQAVSTTTQKTATTTTQKVTATSTATTTKTTR
jgi:hypothetical protein